MFQMLWVPRVSNISNILWHPWVTRVQYRHLCFETALHSSGRVLGIRDSEDSGSGRTASWGEMNDFSLVVFSWRLVNDASQCKVWLSWLYLLDDTVYLRPLFPSPAAFSAPDPLLCNPLLAFRSPITTRGLNLIIHPSFWWCFIIENFKMNYLYTDELSHMSLSFLIYAYLWSLLISGDPLMLLWYCEHLDAHLVLGSLCRAPHVSLPHTGTYNAMPLISFPTT